MTSLLDICLSAPAAIAFRPVQHVVTPFVSLPRATGHAQLPPITTSRPTTPPFLPSFLPHQPTVRRVERVSPARRGAALCGTRALSPLRWQSNRAASHVEFRHEVPSPVKSQTALPGPETGLGGARALYVCVCVCLLGTLIPRQPDKENSDVRQNSSSGSVSVYCGPEFVKCCHLIHANRPELNMSEGVAEAVRRVAEDRLRLSSSNGLSRLRPRRQVHHILRKAVTRTTLPRGTFERLMLFVIFSNS
ncbi:unnamed protein product [Protopolystoma xenopodis]|uniref:Uncharacterized protein n=1 Tax=Protopolystoma xenopodis TaxID=117903 RepID=A0A3S5BD76_9PLAT|nr:unnamed protein product [Protopolystoma xenopodis]